MMRRSGWASHSGRSCTQGNFPRNFAQCEAFHAAHSNSPNFIMKSILLVSLLTFGTAMAQNPPPAPPDAPRPEAPAREDAEPRQRGPKPPHGEMDKVLNSDRIKSAREHAMQAAKEYHEALRAAAIEEDPSIKPLMKRPLKHMDDFLAVPAEGRRAKESKKDRRGPEQGSDNAREEARRPVTQNQSGGAPPPEAQIQQIMREAQQQEEAQRQQARQERQEKTHRAEEEFHRALEEANHQEEARVQQARREHQEKVQHLEARMQEFQRKSQDHPQPAPPQEERRPAGPPAPPVGEGIGR